MASTAALVIVGDEILTGEVEDRNTSVLARGLWRSGIALERVVVVPDRLEAIHAGIAEQLRRVDLVIVSGGIGPTHDDCTRAAVAAALELPLARHPEAERRLREAYGARLAPADLEMADLPGGARLIPGRRLGGFGFQVERVVVFPGVPEYLEDAFETLLAEWPAGARSRAELRVSQTEGRLAPLLRSVQGAHPRVAIGSYPSWSRGGFTVRLVLRSDSSRDLELALTELRQALDQLE
jgi:molybdenum cofactor synthesis domain-containing protein